MSESEARTEEASVSAAPEGKSEGKSEGKKDMKDLISYLVVGTGGFIGANARFIVARWVQQKWGTGFPYGTFLINITGSFILGLFATLALRYAWNDYWRLLIAIGFVGAYTTFSTFEYETLQLVAQGTWQRALINATSSLILGFAAAYGGVITARLLAR